MTKSIRFTALDEHSFEVCPKPFPASQSVPQWWKTMSPYHKGPDNPEGTKLKIYEGHSNATFKKCTPMLDALTSGYLIPLWADVLVEQTPTGPNLSWTIKGKPVFELHGPDARFVERPPGYSDVVIKFYNGWIPTTPKGYSCLFTSPFGYRNLPLQAIPAVVDTDKSTLEILPPMWIKEGFEGIIEKGTPLVQVIPFKREDWTSEFDSKIGNQHMIDNDKNFYGTIVNHYIKKVWSKKTYR